MQAESGFMAITGEVAGEPIRLGVAFVDLAAGANATQAILAALYARERTGMGQSIDIALYDSALHFSGCFSIDCAGDAGVRFSIGRLPPLPLDRQPSGCLINA
jgi:crotonobetainyl-CoA:carnitine CoA-transferase CaiB-like acyl-CoA transferase